MHIRVRLQNIGRVESVGHPINSFGVTEFQRFRVHAIHYNIDRFNLKC